MLSHERALSFADEPSQTVHILFNDSKNKALPSVLHKGIFTVFVDDNIDKSSSSGGVKNNFHGTAMTVLQVPTIKYFSQKRQRKKSMNYQTVKKVFRHVSR